MLRIVLVEFDVRHMIDKLTLTHVITLNYAIVQFYRVNVLVVSGVLVYVRAS